MRIRMRWDAEKRQHRKGVNRMPLLSVPAIYDGEHVPSLEAPPVQGAYSVFVTFVEPVGNDHQRANAARFSGLRMASGRTIVLPKRS